MTLTVSGSKQFTNVATQTADDTKEHSAAAATGKAEPPKRIYHQTDKKALGKSLC